jgi:hypothetical protein
VPSETAGPTAGEEPNVVGAPGVVCGFGGAGGCASACVIERAAASVAEPEARKPLRVSGSFIV